MQKEIITQMSYYYINKKLVHRHGIKSSWLINKSMLKTFGCKLKSSPKLVRVGKPLYNAKELAIQILKQY